MAGPTSARKRNVGKQRKESPNSATDKVQQVPKDGKTALRIILVLIAAGCFYYAASDFWTSRKYPSIPLPVEEKRPLSYSLPPLRPLPTIPDRSASPSQQAAITDAFQHSWSAYVDNAFGFDEYHPLSAHGSNLGTVRMGYTIVDSLDTLILLGLSTDYALARDWVRDELHFNVSGRLNVFETTIRTLGGLLSASALIRDPPHPAIASSDKDADMFLSKAVELADRLLPAFDTPTGIPLREVDLQTGEAFPDVDNNNSSSLAEATTLQLEFKYLAHLTSDLTYWHIAERPMQVVRTASLQMRQYHGLLPIFLDPLNGHFYISDIRLGSRGDSYYEYLIKQYLQTGEGVYKEMYTYALEGIKHVLIKPSVKSDPPLLFTTELTPRRGQDGRLTLRLLPKQDHLVCFLGGAMMLASQHGEEDWRIGHELIRTCVDTYFHTATGLAPEIVLFRTPQDPLAKESDWFIKNYGDRPNPLIDARNILRPETVESLYIAFHLTGDQIYRDWGWRIFQAFVEHCKVPSGGFASIDDVDSPSPNQMDRMETFWLSETLKYLYLLFSDQKLLKLEEWVMNTEAHPLPMFRSSLGERIRSQKSAKGKEGPSGKEVDQHVALTLTKKAGRDALGSKLGLEDLDDPSLIEDPAIFAAPTGVAQVTWQVISQDLAKTGQNSIRFFPPPALSSDLLDGGVEGFVDPRTYGGTSFDLVGNGCHEPLNIIITSHSLTRKGLQTYLRSMDFDKECLSLHAGDLQKAFTDPRGWRDQEFLYRQVFTPLDHVFGTCLESLLGGNHVRVWQQQGGAYFMAASKEMNASKSHMIVEDGYNLGRDELVQKAKGETEFLGTRFKTKIEYVAGLMPEGMEGVNHDIAVDGLTAILTVTTPSTQELKKSRMSFWNKLKPVPV